MSQMEQHCRTTITSLLIFIVFITLAQGHQMYKRQIIFPGGNSDSRGESCNTPDRRQGQCVRITQCQALLRVNNFDRLRRFFCGYEGEEPRVCCPEGSESTGGGRPNPQTTTTRRTPPTRRIVTRPTRPTRTTRTTRGTTQRPRVPGNNGRGGSMPPFLPQNCGTSNSTTTRIVNGREAERGAYPWMALIFKELRRGVKSPDCGASLVTNIHVITAAHCLLERGGAEVDPRRLTIRLGDHHLYRDDDNMNPVEVGVQSIHMHENFQPETFKNDIAVLTLSRPVAFTRNITPICLPYNSLRNEDLAGRSGYVSGWGSTAFNGPSSSVLMEVSIPILDQEECRRIFVNDLVITEEYMCAGTLDGTKDSCQGDSGGPLVIPHNGNRFYLVGIVSFGKRCAQVGFPGVYTRVTMYLDWLAEALS